MPVLGLIAGGGSLPLDLARHCRQSGRPLFVLRLRGCADAALGEYRGEEVGLGQLGRAIALLRREDCDRVCFAGYVGRPDFTSLRPDARGLAALPGAVAAAARGDDGLLTWLVAEFEAEGFVVEGAQEVMGHLLLPPGVLGAHAPAPAHQGDIDRGLQVARTLGALDIGQAAVVCDGLVLAVEAQEGTDAMLRRAAGLPPTLRGAPERRRGVLVKARRPGQDSRIDLPTIGPATVQAAARAGLAGIVGEGQGLLVLDRPRVVRLADSLGLFILGASPPPG